MMKDLYYLDNNAQIMKQQNENVSDYKTSELYKPNHPSKQMRQNPNQQFEGSEDYDKERNTDTSTGCMFVLAKRLYCSWCTLRVCILCTATAIPAEQGADIVTTSRLRSISAAVETESYRCNAAVETRSKWHNQWKNEHVKQYPHSPSERCTCGSMVVSRREHACHRRRQR